MSGLLLGGTLASCVAPAPEPETRRERARDHERWEADRDGHPYRHERWHDQDVYRREDGRWYARRNNEWVRVEGVDIR
jgi:hypothetical protein